MVRSQRIVRALPTAAVLLASLFSIRTARAQVQSPAFVGTFTTTNQIHWDKTLLLPGTYTITFESTRNPMIASIRNAEGDAVTLVMSGSRSGNPKGLNALLLKEKDGQLRVHSLALADLGIVLIYDSRLAREAVQEARDSQSVPVLWAKK